MGSTTSALVKQARLGTSAGLYAPILPLPHRVYRPVRGRSYDVRPPSDCPLTTLAGNLLANTLEIEL